MRHQTVTLSKIEGMKQLRTDYDQWYQVVHDAVPDEDASAPWYGLVREYLGDIRGLRVLEIACGRGGFARQMAHASAQVVACDFSGTALRAAKAKMYPTGAPRLGSLIQADAQSLPFRDKSFDMVVSCETIEHVPLVEIALAEMHRITKPAGKLLLTTPNYFNLMGCYEIYARFRHPKKRDGGLFQPFDRRQMVWQIHRWIRSAGWKILCTDGVVHQFPILPGHNPLRWKSLEAIPILRKVLSPFALTYFVMAQK